MKLSHAERGRKGGRATVTRHGREHMARIGHAGGLAVLERHGQEHMARIGARGFSTYCERHHNGNAESAAFALFKAGRLAHLSTVQPHAEAYLSYCLNCDRRYSHRCPVCGQDPIPF